MTASRTGFIEHSSALVPLSHREVHTEGIAQLGIHAVFQAHISATTPDILRSLERRERIVLILLDGKRTVQDVAHLIHRSELEIARSLIRLLNQGYAEYVGQQTV